MVTASELIAALPPYKDLWITINPDQKVKDIINEVIEAHEEFAPYYDQIAYHFAGADDYETAQNIYNFLKQNIKYKEESDRDQTTALPTGILVRGKGDCKHYASFAAGILDALNREGSKIKWAYRFASYRAFSKTPHHVFVVINPDTSNEIWIDPTPGADKMTPTWQVDKKFRAMLNRNIGGLELIPNQIGKATISVHASTTPTNNIDFSGTGKYNNVFSPYLGLDNYRDFGGDRNYDAAATAAELNQAIASGPHPGHTIDPEFVKWIRERSVRSWNFYYPWGVTPKFTAASILPADYPKLIITPDKRLTFDRDVKIDDYSNAEIHLLTAWAQALIDEFDLTPYPVTPQHLKEFSQLKQGNVDVRNLFNEARGASFIKEIGKGLEKSLNLVKAGVLKVVGSIPRNAFLVLVGLNIFNIAKKLQDKITAGLWEQIAKRWRSLGGNPDKLLATINHGKDKPDPGITEESGETIGEPMTAAAVIAAAAPIIAAMLAFIPDPDGKLHNVLQATKAAAGAIWPNLDLDAYGFLDRNTGQRFEFEVDDIDNENFGGGNNDLPGSTGDPLEMLKQNPVIAAAGVGAALYFIPKKKNLVLAAAAAIATYFYFNKTALNSATLTTAQKINAIKNYSTTDSPATLEVFDRMTADEINTVYTFLFQYVKNNLTVPDGLLKQKITAISDKYNIFT